MRAWRATDPYSPYAPSLARPGCPVAVGFVSHSTIPGEANLTLQFRAPTEAPMEEIERLARSHCEADRSALGLPPLSHARPVRCTIVHEP